MVCFESEARTWLWHFDLVLNIHVIATRVNSNYSPMESLFGYRCQYERAKDERFPLDATGEHGQEREGVLKTPNPEFQVKPGLCCML